jgi:hypothetical protein
MLKRLQLILAASPAPPSTASTPRLVCPVALNRTANNRRRHYTVIQHDCECTAYIVFGHIAEAACTFAIQFKINDRFAGILIKCQARITDIFSLQRHSLFQLVVLTRSIALH